MRDSRKLQRSWKIADAVNKPPRLSSLRVGTEYFGFAKKTERLADDNERRLLELFFAEKRKEFQIEDLVSIKSARGVAFFWGGPKDTRSAEGSRAKRL